MSRMPVDGIAYEVRVGGAGPAVLLLHGFMGRASDFAPFLPALRRTSTTVSVDLLGHGRSDAPAEPARHAVERQAANLATILDRLGLAPALIVGYSFGARIALALAVGHPGAVRGLLLESPSAGIADPAAREERRSSDEALAARIEQGGLEAFVDEWQALPLFAGDRGLPAHARDRLRAARLRNHPAGLAASLRGAGQGAMTPLHEKLAGISVPVTVLAGTLDPVGLARATDVAEAIPRARLVVLEGVGHAPHREAPARFRAILAEAARAATAPPDRADPSKSAAPTTRRSPA
jgi:2-succinyl-6-hydroxy-2,4-cyclohexadiene-1-carboxylate synthase